MKEFIIALILMSSTILVFYFTRSNAAKPFKLSAKDELVFIQSMHSDDLSDADYERIYGSDKDAIKKEKEAWARSGQKVIDDFYKRRDK